MAKVEGPLMSIEARGKIADAIVFFPWKGRHVVRQWLKPTNPKSTNQGYLRSAMKAIGKAIKKIVSVSQGGALDSELYTEATASVDAGLNWNAWLAGGFLELLQSANTLIVGSFTDLVDEYSSLGTDELASFAAEGTSLGMQDFAFGYGYTTNIPAGLQLYFLAHAVYQKTLGSFTTEPKSMATADIGNFADALTTDA